MSCDHQSPTVLRVRLSLDNQTKIIKIHTMKRIVTRATFLARCLAGLLAFGALMTLPTSCSENIDDGNFAIKTEQTITDYLSSTPKFSSIKAIYDRVRLGNSDQASVLTSVLGARGNYTVFAPNNDAINAYVASLGLSSIDELSYEQAELIAKNSIIDNRDEAPYETADFPTPGSFDLSNLNDRTLTCEQDTLSDVGGYIINTNSHVLSFDIELSNGMLHEVDRVIAPSADNLAERIIAADNLKIMGTLLTATSWADSLTAYRDREYDEMNYEEVTDYRISSEPNTIFRQNTTRYIGFTAFVETDDVYKNEWGIDVAVNAEGTVTNAADVLAAVEQKCAEVYGEQAMGDYKNPDNPLNKFVAYHLLYGNIAYDEFVHHCNEYNYMYGASIKKPQKVNMPTNVWDYYTTMGKYAGLIKVTQVGDAGFEQDSEHRIYINRKSIYNDGRTGDYTETGVENPGILINMTNGANDNNAQNGFYYPINKILLYGDEMRRQLASERIRIDMTTMFPEILTNNNRGGDYRLFPKGYINNVMRESSDTHFLYLMCPGAADWNDYQGDEFLVCGLYDFTIKLPPVPLADTYEIRLGTSLNPQRSMAQIYFGDDPLRLSPAGLPFDMRQTVNSHNPEIPWSEDTEDQALNAEIDKDLRNHGYLKGPKYFNTCNGKATLNVRDRSGVYSCMRRIVIQTQLEPNKTYYLRFKSALKKLDSQLFLDFIEYAPKNIFNGAQEEDIW